MTSPITLLIADDHPLFRKGLRQALEAVPAWRIIYEACDGRGALQAALQLAPDICILDIQMPELDGLTVVRRIQASRLSTEIILLTMYKEQDLLDEALDLGVKGYVLKESAVEDILESIQSVNAGHRYVSPGLSDFLVARHAGVASLRATTSELDRLTSSERRILRLIAADRTSKEIADELGLSPRTVENHRTNICTKLDVHGIHSLVKFAYDHKSRL